MFKILDGRDKFYQWDLDRKLIVADSAITQVHFCNRYGNCSLIRVPYEVNGVIVVDVPNVILQDSFALHVYAYDVNYTKQENVFDIVPRTKPEDYVYTEEEVKLWDELEQKLIDIEQVIYADGIEAAVKQYLENNPPQAGATTEEAAQIEQNKADIEELRGEVAAIEIPDVSNFATTGYVDEKIAEIDFPEGADLTGYATKTYVDNAIDNIEHPQPNLSNYATKTYVDNAVGNIDVPDIDLSDYYNKEEVEAVIQTRIDKSFFLDFTDATTTIKQIDTEIEMKLFCEELEKGNSVCANIREASDIAPTESNFFYPAIVQKVSDTVINVMKASINLNGVADETTYGIYQFIKDGSVWSYRRVSKGTYHIATADEVDTKIADALGAIINGEEVSY